MRIDKLRKDTERELCRREWIDTRAFRLKSGTRQFSAGAVFCLLFHGRKRRSAGEVKPREPKATSHKLISKTKFRDEEKINNFSKLTPQKVNFSTRKKMSVSFC